MRYSLKNYGMTFDTIYIFNEKISQTFLWNIWVKGATRNLRILWFWIMSYTEEDEEIMTNP